MKNCIECARLLRDDDFYCHPKSRDGLSQVCKDCHKERMRVRRLTDPEVQRRDRERYQQPARKAHGIANGRAWREKHPEAYRAQTAVNNAVRDRRLSKGPCSICGAKEHVHGHHRDYNKPLEVVWLCAKCHHRLHTTFPELSAHGA